MDWMINAETLESNPNELSEEAAPESEPYLKDLEALITLGTKECFAADSARPEIVVEPPIPESDEADIEMEAVVENPPFPEPDVVSETPSPLCSPPQSLSGLNSEASTDSDVEEVGLIPPPKRKRGRPRKTDVFKTLYARFSATASSSTRARKSSEVGDGRAPAKRRVGRRDDNIECTVCPRRFTRYADMHRHWTSQHSNTKEGCQCSQCGQMLSRPDARKRHERTCCG